MTRRFTLASVLLLLTITACSSEASTGGTASTSAPASTVLSTLTAEDATTTTGADVTTTATAVSATTATVDPGTSTTTALTTPPPTVAPTAPPAPATTVACRVVGNLYGLSDVSGVDVRVGDCGEGVRQVQDELNNKLGSSLSADGRFGRATETAVRNFQASVGLPVDGIVGPETWVALTDDGT